MRQIVVAWINRDPFSATYGGARAAMWLLAGTSADLRACRAHYRNNARRDPNDYVICVLPLTETNPLRVARERIMARHGIKPRRIK